MVYFDLDGFKSINDRFGRGEGDRALKNFALIQKSTFRNSDIVSRLADDDFAVLMTNCNEDQSQSALARLQQAVNQHNRTHQDGYEMAFSAAILACDASQDMATETLLCAAQQLMFVNKRIRQIGMSPQAGYPELNGCSG
jgi:diguanylate cyclase (GGDEF)-like protein